MKKTKLCSIISVLIIIILFSVAAWCGPGLSFLRSIGWDSKPVIDPPGSSGTAPMAPPNTESVTDKEANGPADNDKTKIGPGVAPEQDKIHGVVPTKVTAYYRFSGPGGRWDYFLKIWNVGSIGGEQYREATMDVALVEPFEGVEPLTTVFEGYFTGGPNGDIYLTGEIDGKESSVAFKLYDGEKVIMSQTVSFLIDNPKAFEGWAD